MSNEITVQQTGLVREGLAAKVSAIEAFVSENAIVGSEVEQVGSIMAAVRAASFIAQMRVLVDDEVVAEFKQLQGSPLGFRTDKDKEGGYKEPVIRDALIEASAKGFDMVMNRSNIIGGRWYPTGPGFEQFFKRRFTKDGKPRVTDIRFFIQPPKLITDQRAIVSGKVTYKFDGKDENVTREIPIRINSGQGDDAIIGKAKRKLFAAIYEYVTGSEITDGDVSDTTAAEVVVVEAEKSDAALIAKLESAFLPHEKAINAYMVAKGKITDSQTFRDLKAVDAEQAVGAAAALIKAATK